MKIVKDVLIIAATCLAALFLMLITTVQVGSALDYFADKKLEEEKAEKMAEEKQKEEEESAHSIAEDVVITTNSYVNEPDVELQIPPVTIYLIDKDIAKANISDFLTKQSGIHYTKDSNGFYFLETYYSSRVLHDYRTEGLWWCDSNGIWHDSDGYIVCAAWGIEGDVINTSLGAAKVYDCSGKPYDTEIFVREDGAEKVIGNVSIYVNW